MQVAGSGGTKPYESIPEAAVDIMKNEGPTAFFKGAAARVFRSSPQFAVTLMCYELLHNLVHPEADPRPPTNAPITRKDYEDAFQLNRVGIKAARIKRGIDSGILVRLLALFNFPTLVIANTSFLFFFFLSFFAAPVRPLQ